MKFIKRSLIRRIAATSALNISLCCLIIITVGSISLSMNMRLAITNEMTLNTSNTALQVDQMFESVRISLVDLQHASDVAFQDPDVYLPAEDVYSMVAQFSNISMALHDFESYASKSITSSLANNSDLAGMGVLFEPDAFWTGVHDYSFYLITGMDESDMGHFLNYEDFSTIEYYLGTRESMTTYVTAPYYEGDDLVVTLCEPLTNRSGSFVGIVGADIAVDRLGHFIVNDPDYSTMETSLLDHNLNLAFTTRTGSQIGDPYSGFITDSSDWSGIQSQLGQGSSFQQTTQNFDGTSIVRLFQPVHVGNQTWWVVTSIDSSDLYASTVESVIQLVVVSVILLVFSVFFQGGYLQKTLSPIKKVVEAATEIANGKFDVHVDLKTGDELERLGLAFEEMTNRLQNMVQDISQVLSQVSEKNLDVAPSAEYVGDFVTIERSMETIVGTMNMIISEITMSSHQVAQGASNVTDGSLVLSQGATEQAESIELLSGQVTSISHRISDNASHATRVNEIFTQLLTQVQSGSASMKDMSHAMGDISDSSQQIEKIMKTINDIAFQTNMLALNASVEAARAGEAGKGFAVVAEEVKNLATKTVDASQSTSSLIQHSIEVVKRGSEMVEENRKALDAIVEKISSTTELIQEITEASNEQAHSIQGVTAGIQDITGVVQNNSSAAVESAAASEQLLAQSESLQEMVKTFQLKPDNAEYTSY